MGEGTSAFKMLGKKPLGMLMQRCEDIIGIDPKGIAVISTKYQIVFAHYCENWRIFVNAALKLRGIQTIELVNMVVYSQ